MSLPARFKQSDITRAVKGALAAGLRVGKVQIDPNGNIIILSDNGPAKGQQNSWSDLR